MYTSTRLEWHLGVEKRSEPLSALWWVLSSNKQGFCLFSTALLSLVPRAKIHQSTLRGFSIGADRQGALADGLHGLNPRNTALSTPESQMRPALIERLVKDWVHGGNKAQSISESIRHAHLGLFCSKSSLEQVGKPFFPPLVELCLKEKI